MNTYYLIYDFFFVLVLGDQEVVMDPTKPEESKKNSLVTGFQDDIRSYAGYFDIVPRNNSKLFFWFCEHQDEKTPVIIWLQGQPGLSSLYGLFEEHGPYKIDEKTLTLEKREYALTNTYHVLYLDHDTNCGFSYTSERAVYGELKHIPEQLYMTLIQFFKIFNEYSQNDLYLAGESSAHRIIPQLVSQMNEHGCECRLKGILIGGGVFHLENSFHYVQSFFRLGSLDTKQLVSIQRPQHDMNAFLRANRPLDAMEKYNFLMFQLEQATGYKSLYDIRDPNVLAHSIVPTFLSGQQIKNIIHASSRPFQNRTQTLVGDLLVPVEELYNQLIPTTRILLYNGQFDVFSNYASASLFLSALEWHGAEDYYNEPRKHWILDDRKLLGYWKTVGNVTHVFVRNAGHFVGKTQPKALYHLVSAFIEDKFH